MRSPYVNVPVDQIYIRKREVITLFVLESESGEFPEKWIQIEVRCNGETGKPEIFCDSLQTIPFEKWKPFES